MNTAENHAMSISELLFAIFGYFFLIKKLNVFTSACGASLILT